MRKALRRLTAAVLAGVTLSFGAAAFAGPLEGGVDVAVSSAGSRQVQLSEKRAQLRDALAKVQLDSKMTVTEALLTDEAMQKGIDLLADKAVIASGQDGAQSFQVPLYGSAESVAGVVFDDWNEKKPFPAPISQVKPAGMEFMEKVETSVGTTKPVVGNTHKDGCTGVIIDCRELKVTPMMKANVENDWGHIVYSWHNFDYKDLCKQSVISYVADGEAPVRAGERPITVKGLSITENGNIMLRTEDSNRILILNNNTGFLQKMNVVVLL